MNMVSQVRRASGVGVLVAAMALLAGCQTQPPAKAPQATAAPAVSTDPQGIISDRNQIAIKVPVAWGGEVRCHAGTCLLAAVEHEEGMVVVHRIQDRKSTPLDRAKVAYHPDSAAWLEDDLLVAAVEASNTLDIFRLKNDKLERLQQIKVQFPPRDVIVLKAENGRYTLMATPYSGKQVAFVLDWAVGDTKAPNVQKTTWCEAPWHPTKLPMAKGISGPAIGLACLDGKQLLAVPASDLLAKPTVLANFPVVSRNARPTPSGKWVYVSLETEARNARVNMETGELQWIKSPLTGSVSVAPLDDDLVVWGEDRELYLQRLDAQGEVLETRWYAVNGFATSLQLLDVDNDGQRDLVVYNSGGETIDIVYGPLWDNAKPERIRKPRVMR
jgi:hypothetical protein